jgi:hypothetical protein
MVMNRTATLVLAGGGMAAALALAVAARSSALAQAQPGLWEISGAPAAGAPVRQCVADVAALARFEHRSRNCTAKVLSDSASSTTIDYSCGGAGFGHSQVQVITPRSLRISTQGISDGLPFNYVLQARRIDDCPKSASSARH